MLQSSIESVCASCEQKLRSGQRNVAEQVLAAQPGVAGDIELALELIYREFVTLEELGERPQAAEFVARFPQWADRLERVLALHAAFAAEDASMIDTPAIAGTDSEITLSGRRVEVPASLGPFEIIEEIGRGGMGVVYRARDVELDRVVALKVIRTASDDPQTRERFRREAEAAARLQHPNIVQIFQVGEADGCPYLAMEYVDGGSLQEHTASRRPSADSAAAIVETLALAIHSAHERSILHRDLKPANILMTSDGQPRIADFGLAKLVESDTGQTRSGALLGTPCYMAPEQAGRSPYELGPGADIYSLGAILYELLTGRPPFQGESVLETLEQARSIEPVSPSMLQPGLSRDLETICLKCLAKEPHRRYLSANDLAEDLGRFRSGSPITARPVGRLERAGKWTRRHPAVASLLATVVLITCLGFSGVLWQWSRAESNWTLAETRRETADFERAQAVDARNAERDLRERAESDLYFHRIALAQREWLSNDPDRAIRQLEQCPPHLRSWEWDHLNAQFRSGMRTLGRLKRVGGHVAISPDGSRAAACSGTNNDTTPGELMIWDLNTGELLTTWRPPHSRLSRVDFSADGHRLAASGVGLHVFDADSGELIRSLDEERFYYCLAMHPDGKSLVGGSTDGVIREWDVASGEPVRELIGHSGAVHGLDMTPDGSSVASASRDGSVRVWDHASGKQIHITPENGDLRCVSFSPDGRFVAAGGYGRNQHAEAMVWELGDKPREVAARRFSEFRYIPDIAFSPDGQYVAMASGDGSVRLWDPVSSDDVAVYKAHSGTVSAVAFSSDGRTLASLGLLDRTIRLWDRSTEIRERLVRNNSASVHQIAIQPNGHQVALPGGHNQSTPGAGKPILHIWNQQHGLIEANLSEHEDWIQAVAYSSDGHVLASGSDDCSVCLYHAEAHPVLLARLRAHEDAITGVAFDPAIQWVASSSRDGSVRIWDLSNVDLPQERRVLPKSASFRTSAKPLFDPPPVLRVLHGHAGAVDDLAVSPSGKLIATAGEDHTVRVWDVATGTQLQIDRGHKAGVLSVAFSRDGRWLASSDTLGVIRIQQRSDDHQRVGYEIAHEVTRDGRAVQDIEFTADSKRLAAIDATALCLWDVQTGQEAFLEKLENHTHRCLAFSPNGRTLLFGYGNEVFVRRSEVQPLDLPLLRQDSETFRKTGTEQSNVGQEQELSHAQRRLVNWHRRDLQRSNDSGNTFGADFHLDALAALQPSSLEAVRLEAEELVEQGEWDAAIDRYQKLSEILDDHALNKTDYVHENAQAVVAFALKLRDLRRLAPAADLLQSVVATLEKHLNCSSNPRDTSMRLAKCSNFLAYTLRLHNHPSGSQRAYRRSLEIWTRLCDEQPENSGWHISYANVLLNSLFTTRRDEAAAGHSRVVEIQRRVVERDPQWYYRRELALGLDSAARFHTRHGDFAKAEPLSREALAIRLQLDKEKPGTVAGLEPIGRSHDTLARIMEGRKQIAESADVHAAAAATWRQLVERSPETSFYHQALINRLTERAAALSQAGDADAARQALAGSIEAKACFIRQFEPSLSKRNELAWQLTTSTDTSLHDPAQAVELMLVALEQSPNNGAFWNTLGVGRYRNDELPECIEALEKSMRLRRGGNSEDWYFLAMTYWRLGEESKARDWLTRAVEWHETKAPKSDELRRFRAEAEELIEQE